MCANTDPALWHFTAFLKSSCVTHQNNMGISRERTLLEKAKVYWISRDLDAHLPSLVSKASACSSQYKGCQAESHQGCGQGYSVFLWWRHTLACQTAQHKAVKLLGSQAIPGHGMPLLGWVCSGWCGASCWAPCDGCRREVARGWRLGTSRLCEAVDRKSVV